MSNVEGAIEDYEKAIGYPANEASATAYYNLGMTLKLQGGDTKTIENHIEMALNLGIDLTVSLFDLFPYTHYVLMLSIPPNSILTLYSFSIVRSQKQSKF